MQLDIFSPKAPPLFGLDISSSSVKMLEIVDAGKGAYRVERYVIEPLPRDATVDGNISNLEMVVESVKRGYKRLGTRAKHVAMAVPTGAVITKKIIVPASLRENELEVQVESEANQYIPFALEEVNDSVDRTDLVPPVEARVEAVLLVADEVGASHEVGRAVTRDDLDARGDEDRPARVPERLEGVLLFVQPVEVVLGFQRLRMVIDILGFAIQVFVQPSLTTLMSINRARCCTSSMWSP